MSRPTTPPNARRFAAPAIWPTLGFALPLLATLPGQAHAATPGVTTLGNMQFSTSLSSLPSNAGVTTVSLGTSSITGLVSQASFTQGSGASATTIAFSGSSGIYHGTTSGIAAAPYSPSGVTTGNYFSAEKVGNVAMTYSTGQHYFGLLWGSVDKYNSLQFYSGGKLVGTLSGGDIAGNANGDQGSNGSYFVNINFSGVTYDRVVAVSTSNAFEFQQISASVTEQAIAPAPPPAAAASAAGLAILMIGSVWRLRPTRAAQG